MKTLSHLLLAAALLSNAGFVNAAPAPKAIVRSFETEDRHLSGYHAIEASGSFDVVVTQNGRESVRVEAPSDVINRIETVVEGGVLKLRIKKGNWNWGWNNNGRMVIYVEARDLNAVSLSGSGDVDFKNGLKARKLDLNLSGSGGMSGRIETEKLSSTVTGSGEMKLAGRAERSEVMVTGSGDYSAGSLTTAETDINVTGSGSARVNVNTRINATVTGSGDIYYSGDARQIATSKHGSGEIHHI